ncbi:MAG: hypothetical protein KAU16_05715 [Methanophagales archaeon]|nr:hypothetical protein [Methanophagales archaeon]
MKGTENKAKSVKLVTGTLTWLKPEGIKREGKRKKTCPLRNAKQFDQTFLKFDAKLFGQAFLKLDAWCESTRGRSDKKVR